MANGITCGIYRIGSKIHPDRCYIGSAKNIKKRWSRHKKDLEAGTHNPILQAHYNKYGFDDLIFSVVEEFDFISKEHTIGREQYYMDNDPLNCYFNVNKKADSCEGSTRVLSEKHKQAISRGRKGIVFTEEHRANISKGRKGIRGVIKKENPNYHANSGSWGKGHEPWNKGKKGVMEPWNKGKHGCFSDEAIEKMSKSHLGQEPANKGKKRPYKPRPKQVEAMRRRREEKLKNKNNNEQ